MKPFIYQLHEPLNTPYIHVGKPNKNTLDFIKQEQISKKAHRQISEESTDQPV